ncbi:MAG TPA: mechanosensitive ion channel family protein [Rhodanobacteraceae bacterium]|nr:mechanosensitive ion channel family protein [Rhodanobacteraceae bacterium]
MNFIPFGPPWLDPLVVLACAAVIGWIVYLVLFGIIARFTGGRFASLAGAVVHNFRAPSRWLFPVLGVLLALSVLPVPTRIGGPLAHAIAIVLIGIAAWLVVRLIDAMGDMLSARYDINVPDNLEARKVRTQFRVLRRIGAVAIGVLALSAVLMTFPGIRALGATLFASAGAAGLVVGLAAKPVLTNWLAGIQIALTQPIRLEDAVIVENDWGWIEEINITYVVMRTWDWRRWVIPISYFVEQPFQNWTKQTAQLIGSIHMFVDYTAPLEEMRKEMDRLVKATDKWRGEVVVLQVVEATEHSMQLRILADAKDAGTAWDLRCYIREGLIRFLQENHPECLPRTRADIDKFPVPPQDAPPRRMDIAPAGSDGK